MHRNVILTNKRPTHAQSNYTDTKLKVLHRLSIKHMQHTTDGITLTVTEVRMIGTIQLYQP